MHATRANGIVTPLEATISTHILRANRCSRYQNNQSWTLSASFAQAMSEHDSESLFSEGSGSRHKKHELAIDDLVKKVHGKLGHSGPLSLTQHLGATKKIRVLRDRLANGESLDSKTLILMLCTGIACHRRWAVGEASARDTGGDGGGIKDEAAEIKMNEDARELVKGTATLLFTLLCLAERKKNKPFNLETAREAVATAGLTSVWAQLKPKPVPKKKKKKKKPVPNQPAAEDEEEEEELDEEDRREQAMWEIATRLSASEVARHTLTLGVSCLEDEASNAIDGLMAFFFRSAGANMAESMLMPDGNQDFVSLALAKPMAEMKGEERTKRLKALSIAAESEAGQSVVRDMLLSFLLPASHVGVRRTLVLTRASSTRAGVDYPELTSRSHEVA